MSQQISYEKSGRVLVDFFGITHAVGYSGYTPYTTGSIPYMIGI